MAREEGHDRGKDFRRREEGRFFYVLLGHNLDRVDGVVVPACAFQRTLIVVLPSHLAKGLSEFLRFFLSMENPV